MHGATDIREAEGFVGSPFAELVKVFQEVLVDDREFAREHAPRVEVRCVRLERLVVPCANGKKQIRL